MNWTQAMAAMINGQKVRHIEWCKYKWISSENRNSTGTYTFEELQSMDWEIYEEPTDLRDFASKACGQCPFKEHQK